MDLHFAPFTRQMKQRISLNIGRDVKRLGQKLGFTEPQLHHLEQSDLYEFSFQMLTKWEQKQGIVAPLGKIVDSLKFMNRYDLLHLICPKEFPEVNHETIHSDFVSQRVRENIVADRAVLQKLDLKLKQHYSDIQLPQPQWTTKILPLDELYVDMEMFEVDKYGNESKGIQMQIHQLFDMQKNQLPKRILIEGSPGFGKTTFALKLLYDWVAGEPYINSFHAVFSIALSNFNGYQSLERVLLEIMSQANGCNDDLNSKCLEEYQEEMLLILDGYDELQDQEINKILPVLQRSKFEDMFVILTSRRGLVKFELDTSQSSRQLQLGATRTYVWNKRILLKGISECNRRVFITKYFENDGTLIDKTMNIYEKASGDIYQCPLFLMLLVSMSSEDDEFTEAIDSRTSLYKNFFNFIMRYGLIRGTLLYSHERVNMFSTESASLEYYAQHFSRFGKLALKCLIENDLFISEKELLRCSKAFTYFLNLGIFKKNLIFRHRNRIEVFEPMHKTFYEFSAAYYLFGLLGKQSSKFDGTLISCVERGFGLNTESLVFPFLGGLLNERTPILLKALSPWAPIFPDHSEWTLSILQEVKDMAATFSVLLPFVPPLFNFNVLHARGDQFMNMFICIFRGAKEVKIIKMLKMNVDSLLKINACCYFHIDKIMLQIDHRKNIVCPDFRTSNISCNEFIFQCKVEHLTEDEWDLALATISSIVAIKKSLTLTCNDKGLQNFHTCCNKQSKRDLIFHDMTICIDRLDEKSCAILTDLIVDQRIRNGMFITLASAEEKELQKMINVIASNNLEEFGLLRDFMSSQKISVNMSDTHKIQSRPMHSLRFRGIQFIGNGTSNSWPVKEVSVHCVPSIKAVEILKQFNGVEFLDCSCEVLNLLTKSGWFCLKTITEVCLNTADKLENLLHLKNLTVLTLNVFCQVNMEVHVIVELITNSRLQRLDLLDIRNDAFLTSVLRDWLDKVQGKDTNLRQHCEKTKIIKEFVIEFCASVNLPDKNFTHCFPFLRELLKNKHLMKFTAFTFIGGLNINPSLFSLSSNFKMDREVRGITTNSSRMQHQSSNLRVDLFAYREGVSITCDEP